MSKGWKSPHIKEVENVSTEKLRVYLCIQLMLLRHGFSHLLNATDGITVIGDGDSLQELMALPPSSADVFVVDADLIQFDFEKTLRWLAQKAAIVLIFQKAPQPELLRLAMKAKIYGYVCGASTPETLYAAIRAAAVNQVHLDAMLVDSLVGIIQRDGGKSVQRNEPVEKSSLALAPREIEVLKMVVRGFKNSEIAEKLGISIKTVDTHRYRGLGKLNLHSRAELVAYGLQVGWLSSDKS